MKIEGNAGGLTEFFDEGRSLFTALLNHVVGEVQVCNFALCMQSERCMERVCETSGFVPAKQKDGDAMHVQNVIRHALASHASRSRGFPNISRIGGDLGQLSRLLAAKL